MGKITKVQFELQFDKQDRSKYTVKEFPELGTLVVGDCRKVWRHWLKVGAARTRQQFDTYHGERAQLRQASPERQWSICYEVEKMKKLGIAALPPMVAKVKEGDVALIPAISELTRDQVPKDATQEQCVAWWEASKQRWLIPFDGP